MALETLSIWAYGFAQPAHNLPHEQENCFRATYVVIIQYDARSFDPKVRSGYALSFAHYGSTVR